MREVHLYVGAKAFLGAADTLQCVVLGFVLSYGWFCIVLCLVLCYIVFRCV